MEQTKELCTFHRKNKLEISLKADTEKIGTESRKGNKEQKRTAWMVTSF